MPNSPVACKRIPAFKAFSKWHSVNGFEVRFWEASHHACICQMFLCSWLKHMLTSALHCVSALPGPGPCRLFFPPLFKQHGFVSEEAESQTQASGRGRISPFGALPPSPGLENVLPGRSIRGAWECSFGDSSQLGSVIYKMSSVQWLLITPRWECSK